MSPFQIHVYDEFSPEDTAMMQALYSRSNASVTEHVDRVRKSGSGKFMERYYVGYGHKSIADCGSVTIFIEGVSMLCAKAIQDWPLYSGQETSSRYIDMAEQRIEDPVGDGASSSIMNKWIEFYRDSMEEVQEHMKELYPLKETEKSSVYERAVAAWSFDVLRGFLPAGCTTQLSWHTNLRQAWDKLYWLMRHPLQEVRDVAKNIFDSLTEKYPTSFCFKETPEQVEYAQSITNAYTYVDLDAPTSGVVDFSTSIDPEALSAYEKVFADRPKYTPLPQFLREEGNVQFTAVIDFGSFRDIQRHRNGVCRMPLLTERHGFHTWYLEQLPQAVRERAEKLLEEQKNAVDALDCSELEKQYFIPMGYNVVTRVTYPLHAAVYTIELRAGKTVHPTLRTVAHAMHKHVASTFPMVKLWSDLSPSDRDIRRGKQDIVESSKQSELVM